jgi:hypothetical protein
MQSELLVLCTALSFAMHIVLCEHVLLRSLLQICSVSLSVEWVTSRHQQKGRVWGIKRQYVRSIRVFKAGKGVLEAIETTGTEPLRSNNQMRTIPLSTRRGTYDVMSVAQ